MRSAISVFLTGGEPFLHPDIFPMIEFANLRHMQVTVSTNGSVLGDKIEQIIASPLSSMNVSLNATNSNEYEQMNGSPKHEFYTVLDNITNLVMKRINRPRPLKLKLSCVCMKMNYKRIPEMIQLAVDLKVDEMLFHNLIPFDLPNFPREQVLYDDDADVYELMKSVEPSAVIISLPRLYKKKITERYCTMPFTTLPIMSDGEVNVCCQNIDTSSQCGNVLHDQVWNDLYFQQMRKILIDLTEPLPELCKVCPEMFRPHQMLPIK